MSAYSSKMPWGKILWLWELKNCEGGDLQKIIQKCKDTNVSTVLIKSGDGENTWDQWNQELVDTFHKAGMKIMSWSFVYGTDPLREAAIAMWSLDMGADGHIFDAEDQYEKLPNPGQAATAMLQAVRGHAPDAFLAYSPEPIIDYHQYFPYVEFGKYCDAVLPQVYFGEWNKTPQEGINWMYDNWSRWQKKWKDSGFSDSVKPLIPVCQAYDDYAITPEYILKPQDILDFCIGVKGYKSVAFWSYQHILRPDCWNAIKNAEIDAPTNSDLGLPDSQNTPKSQDSALSPTPPSGNIGLTATKTASDTPISSASEQGSSVSTPSEPTKVEIPHEGSVIITAPLGNATVVTKNNPTDPAKVDIHITHQPVEQKVLLDYIIGFWEWFSHKFKKEVKN